MGAGRVKDTALWRKYTGWSNNEVTIDGVKYRRMKKGDATYSVDYEDEYYQWSDTTSWHYFRYVFLLSKSDVYSGSNAAAYGFVRDEETRDEARRTQGTAYAKAMGLYTECAETAYAGNCIWWLRTPGVLSTFAGTADYDRYVDMDGMDVDNESIGVRPALWIDTTADCWSDAGTVCSDGTVLEK